MERINYSDLNGRQKETYNFQKVSAVLADYGFATIKLNDDWESADFLAQHIDGKTFFKVQLKSRLTFDRKYVGKDLFICFPYKNDWYLFDHDKMLRIFLKKSYFSTGESSKWARQGLQSWPRLSLKLIKLLEHHNSIIHDIIE